MRIQAVIGANYGDEGKGLVSGCLAREANKRGDRILTVFFNGTMQRAHTFEGEIHRAMAAGTKYGSDTYYHRMFVVDPISLLILQAKPVISPECRLILPYDVTENRKKETKRGAQRHGSCGFGLFEAMIRGDRGLTLHVKDVSDPYGLYEKTAFIRDHYYDKCPDEDDLYNMDNFMKAVAYMKKECRIATFEEIAGEYDTIIFEGGQGLMLDQYNIGYFPHLTPSSTGSKNFAEDVRKTGIPVELYYVSRSYLTRHGAGRMEGECAKEDIHPDITDGTNLPNEFQGELRFGRISPKLQKSMIFRDAEWFAENERSVRIVFTQTNYTGGKIETTEGLKDPEEWREGLADHIYVSDQKDRMERLI